MKRARLACVKVRENFPSQFICLPGQILHVVRHFYVIKLIEMKRTLINGFNSHKEVLERRKKEEFEKLESLTDQAALPVLFSNTSLAALGSSHTWSSTNILISAITPS